MSSKLNRKNKIALAITASILLVLIAARLAMPSIILKHVNNDTSQSINGFTFSAEDVALSVLTGSYTLTDVQLNKNNGDIQIPFFTAEDVTFSIEWKALLKAEIVGETHINKPVLNFVKGQNEVESQLGIAPGWTIIISKLMPWQVNRIEVEGGKIYYHDVSVLPMLHSMIDSVYLTAKNLANVTEEEDALPSSVSAIGKLYGGTIKLGLLTNALQQTPAFELNAELSALNLYNLKDVLRTYWNVDVSKGTYELYTEAATRNNKVIGFAAPSIKDVNAKNWNNEEITQRQNDLGVHQLVSWSVNNSSKNKTTQIDFEGEIEKTNSDLWGIVGETLETAFVKSLVPAVTLPIEQQHQAEIQWQLKKKAASTPVVKENNEKKGGFFKKLFKKKDGKEEKKKRKKND